MGTNSTAETVGVAAVAGVAAGVAIHGAATMVRHACCDKKKAPEVNDDTSKS